MFVSKPVVNKDTGFSKKLKFCLLFLSMLLIVLFFIFNSKKPTTTRQLIQFSPIIQSLEEYVLSHENETVQNGLSKYKIKRIILRDEEYYTQGLFIKDGVMYESTGLYGESKIVTRSFDKLQSFPTVKAKLSEKFFGEGMDFYQKVDGTVEYLMLTWREGKVLVFDQGFNQIKTLNLPAELKEGWGLTHDPAKPNIFFVTDSGNTIFECDYLQNFKVVKKHNFFYNQKPVRLINELEFVKNRIWANVYMESVILVLNLDNDQVEKVYNM